jgi:hypothetical protein
VAIIEATAGVLLVHVPPVVVLVRVVVEARHNEVAPPIGGVTFTVSVFIALQPGIDV